MPRGIYNHRQTKKPLYSVELNERRSKTMTGRPKSEKARKNMKGRSGVYPRSEETRKKIGDAQRGENNHRWKGGKANKLIYTRKRQLEKKGNGGSHTLEEWEELKKKYNYMCLCCKKFEPEIKITEDHIIPVKFGGLNNIENIQPLCKSCNSKKYTKVINYQSNI